MNPKNSRTSGRGKTRRVTSVIMPKQPSEPMNNWVRSGPIAFRGTLVAFVWMTFPVGNTTSRSITMSEPTVNTRTSLQVLRQTYTDHVFKTVIPKNVDMKDANFNKADIYSYNPKAKAALAYQKLIREVFL